VAGLQAECPALDRRDRADGPWTGETSG